MKQLEKEVCGAVAGEAVSAYNWPTTSSVEQFSYVFANITG